MTDEEPRITFACQHCGVTQPGLSFDESKPATSPLGWVMHSVWSQETDTGLVRVVMFSTCSNRCFKALLENPPKIGDLWINPAAQA